MPTKAEYRRAYKRWWKEGQRLHGALLDIWRLVVPDSEYGVFAKPRDVVKAVRARLAADRNAMDDLEVFLNLERALLASKREVEAPLGYNAPQRLGEELILDRLATWLKDARAEGASALWAVRTRRCGPSRLS